MSIFSTLVLVNWLALAAVWLVSSFTAKKSISGAEGLRGIVIQMVAVAGLVILGLVGHFNSRVGFTLSPSTHPLVAAFGVFITAVGIGFAIWARLHLGTNWGMPMTEREDPELVTTGPYAHVRHPIYTGMLFALLGSALVAGPWWLATFCGALVYFAYSATREEKAMQRRFPDSYPAYRERTRMLIPLVF